MEVNIITFSCAFNYGAMLQTYGLYKTLLNAGHRVKVIDYIPVRYNVTSKDYIDYFLSNTRLWKINYFTRLAWKKTRYHNILKNREIFRKFLEKNIELTNTYYSDKELKANPPIADVYITGSDQVWNPDFLWEDEIDYPFYLSFVERGKRISYASSFGKSVLSQQELVQVKNYLSRYSFISTRESSGVDIVRSMGLDAVEVSDPTILAGIDVFNDLITNEHSLVSGKYIVLFQIHFSKSTYEQANNYCKKNGFRLITILPDYNDRSKCKNAVVVPSVEEWLRYIKYSEFVITDSFHATAFSLMYEKNFVVCAQAGYEGRITNILRKVGLENHLVDRITDETISTLYYEDIDYNIVSGSILQWREESFNWLINAVEG